VNRFARRIVGVLVRIRDREKECCVWTYVNSAVRIAAAPRAVNRHLGGVGFFVSGEPITTVEVREILPFVADPAP
jgi:hypothetical protein